MNLFKHNLKINKAQNMVKITHIVKEDIKKSEIQEGMVLVYCPHTTAGITINENADPDVVHDILYGFEKIFPDKDGNYEHREGNSHAHMKASLVGASTQLIIHGGKLLTGTWQDIYFCEFDGPRNRNFYVKILEG